MKALIGLFTLGPTAVIPLLTSINQTNSTVAPGIVSAIGAQASVTARTGQMTADTAKASAMADTLIKTTPMASIPRYTAGCTVTKARQEASNLHFANISLSMQYMKFLDAEGAGPNADQGSPAVAGEAVNDRCQLGFIDNTGKGRYGELPTQGHMDCKDPSGVGEYFGRDGLLSSVLDPLEYPVPDGHHWQQLPDGHISFIGKGGAPGADVNWQEKMPGVGSEMDFAAAWKYCEHLRAQVPTPTHNSGTATAGDIVNMNMDMDTVARSNAAAELCFKAIVYRQACPRGTENTVLNPNGVVCAKQQQAVCNRLISAPSIGYGLTFTSTGETSNDTPPGGIDANGPITGDQEYADILAGCKAGQGISMAAYDAIMAHKCDDDNYMQGMANRLAAQSGAYENFVETACPAMANFNDTKLIEEKKTLEKATKNMQLLNKHMTPGGKPLARVVGH